MADRFLVPLTPGNLDLIRRALRVYAHTEQQAISDAARDESKKGQAHSADLKRQAQSRITATEALLDELLRGSFRSETNKET